MSFARIIIAALVLAVAVPMTASAQDRRSPDAAGPPPIVQDLRSPDARDGFVAPETPTASPQEAFPWVEAGALGAVALVLSGLGLRRRFTARA
jgi:hypothetical protein